MPDRPAATDVIREDREIASLTANDLGPAGHGRAGSPTDAQDRVSEVFLAAWAVWTSCRRATQRGCDGAAGDRESAAVASAPRGAPRAAGTRGCICFAGVAPAGPRGDACARSPSSREAAHDNANPRRRTMNTLQGFEALRRANPRTNAGFVASVDE